jgi:hypothetical protein
LLTLVECIYLIKNIGTIKVKRFEPQLEAALRRHGWTHEETLDLRDHWWAARAWRIRSTKANFGYEQLLTFVGHYQDGNEVDFDDLVGQIIVTERIPADHLSIGVFPKLAVDTHDYSKRVESFLVELDDRRSGRKKPTQAQQDAADQPATAKNSKAK